MRKLLSLVLVFAALFALAVPARAATGASDAQVQVDVASDGSATVAIELSLHLDGTAGELVFPVPRAAKNVTVSGGTARVSRKGDVQNVDLSRLVGGLSGDFSVLIRYSLTGLVAENEKGQQTLTLPVLSGFAYPVASLTLTVRMPGELAAEPVFSSGYYKTDIAARLTVDTDGGVITCRTTESLKDHETLTMTLSVPAEQFPQTQPARDVQLEGAGVWLCALLAALYWLLTMRCLPPRRGVSPVPPEGLSAGELTSALTGQGADLTAMVLSWAQLGYLVIYLDRDGRVLLHKRMEMGNERSAFEVRRFRALFGSRTSVDATGEHYARLCRETAAAANPRGYFLPKSGNPRLLRILAAGMGVFGGATLGAALGGSVVLDGVLIVALGIFGALSAWRIQAGAYELFRRSRRGLIWSAALGAVWLLLGILAGRAALAALVAAGEFVFGLAAAYGGRRTALGRQAMAQTLGLRRYLKQLRRAELQRASRDEPDYFFRMAPYAMALGVGRPFAKRFGGMRMPNCPYLTTGMDAHMTAGEWMAELTKAADGMDALPRLLPYARILGVFAAAAAPAPKKKNKSRRR